ncbi:protein TUNICAMYCIN INDUCED 1-like [Rutidosis leptorrhynchoides]|uniref:protein TUNICAMYCIN INDUCED 1-like n=1 Tax=Rutidosis leptorrhynchoides TaxID=125765 RepID=UPI003A9A2C6B
MAVRVLSFANYVCFFVLILQFMCSNAMISMTDMNQQHPKAISDLKEAIVKGLGLQSDDFKITGFDSRDALVGRSVAYEFDVEIDDKVLPFKLLEDVHKWEYVDLPIFQMEDRASDAGDDNGLVEKKASGETLPVLAPFQLAGPMELWIQDAKDMRLSLPHDVDAGELRKVILADGAVVTIKGARSVSLRHPIELPLPLNKTQNGFASGLLTLAERLRHASRTQTQLLSLRIVGPTSLTSPATSSPSFKNKLKLKRIAPGLVELSSVSKMNSQTAISTIDLQGEAPTLLTPDHFTTLWPVTSLNGSNSNLLGLERLLGSVLGSKASKDGTFKLLKADVSAHTFVKMGFGVEKKLTGDVSGWEGQVGQLPEWRTKPETMRMHFEVLAKVDGNKFVPESVMQVNPVPIEHTIAPNVATGNTTMSKVPIVYPPVSPFTL